ncbi:histidine kinase-like ATPase [Mucor mucedo]|uniref:histidine kinase-like ATPase n=1 Tax=Mucor mucedo TaxID=29922 RepID=UPI0022200409|nr:histidine kinase-like ATPase [Mucor mucedo]KAI7866694.1 histidine kinase-like ATPase [Mucor mucedo]
MKRIAKLSPSVVNRIAAGEIIHHPYNAVKELLENSLDAGATRIRIHVSNGGFDLIKIIDNGHGIKVDDMPLVCERYATSKLEEFKDLDKIETFGFRGEALASISQIAKVIIVSKPHEESYGYQAIYQNGNILSKPKICASNYGTMISIHKLFDNTPIRKKALGTAKVEENHIADIVKKYAIHNPSVGFSLQKDNKYIISETKANNHMNRIQQIFGTSISSRLRCTKYSDGNCNFELYFHDMKDETHYKIDNKNGPFILFVNNRLVENGKLKREIKQVYNNIRIGYKPRFIYLSLNVKPVNVDVNIHPTKNEVHLLNEEQITDSITASLQLALDEGLSEPTTIKPKKSPPTPLPEKATLNHYFKTVPASIPSSPSSESRSTDNSPRTPPNDKRGPLDGFFQKIDKVFTENDDDPSINRISRVSEPKEKTPMIQSNLYIRSQPKRIGVYLKKSNDNASLVSNRSSKTSLVTKEDPQKLESILIIKSEIRNAENKEFSKVIANHQCVGLIDDILVLIVFKNTYYLMNYNVISEELFYQLFINKIGKFGKLLLSTPIPISSGISLFAPDKTSEELIEACDSLVEHQDLLSSYYSIGLASSEDDREVYLTYLPMLLTNYIPSFDKLPILFHNIATQIDWENEIDCLDALARELSSFYCCCSMDQYSYLIRAAREGDFKAPKYLKNDYIVKLDFPNEIISNTDA